MPGPPVFGAAFDAACRVFATTATGAKGQCLFYDKEKMALLLFTICLCVKLGSLVFIVCAWKLYKPPTKAIDGETTLNVEKVQETTLGVDNRMTNGGGMVNSGYQPEVQTLPVGNGHIQNAIANGNLDNTYL